MAYCVDDTIAAIASAPGGAARGILRLSGPDTIACLRDVFAPDNPVELGRINKATVVTGSLNLEELARPLPCDLYLWPTSRSYTQQVSAELHTIGSPPLLDVALNVLCRAGARLAEPGEFTMRAFLAGRLDLTQAEAVLGVVDAEDMQSLNGALAQLAGGLADPLQKLRSDLLDLLADLEAGLDFVDEDISFVSQCEADERLGAAQRTIEHVLSQIASRGTSTREPRVVLRGWANVGKSSLVNALCRGQVAIVSNLAGTTSDYVCRRFCWKGVSGVLVDTAGADATSQADADPDAAQRLSERQLRQAELELFCLDATRPLNAWERAALEEHIAHPRLIVWTKIDAGRTHEQLPLEQLGTSSVTGAGIDQLRMRICHCLGTTGAPATTVVASTAQRCRSNLETAVRHLEAARQLLVQAHGDELVAFEMREALEHVGQVVGAVYTDDILDRIFHRFCIGK